MRIAVDASELAGKPTGVGRYLWSILSCWAQDPDASRHEVTLYAPQQIDGSELVANGGAQIKTVVLPGRGGTWWEQTHLPRAIRSNADVLFSPGYSAPLLSTVPVVVAIHDVSFFAHPEWFRPREGFRRRTVVRAAARRAARVLTISEFSRQEIRRWLGIAPDRIVVTPVAVGGWARARANEDEARRSANTPTWKPEPLVLYVGSLLNRRHLPDLVRAFARVLDHVPDAELVIVGENRSYPLEDPSQTARALGIERRVFVRSYVPDAELSELYRRAGSFAFLSTYEGFGMTPLEAMAEGAPAVVYDTPVAREAYGDAALFVRPGDIEGVARALTQSLTDAPLRERLQSAARECVARYSWTRTAAATLATLEEAARPS
jgi:glycosyltransferase involved in cell wall biosynthesis